MAVLRSQHTYNPVQLSQDVSLRGQLLHRKGLAVVPADPVLRLQGEDGRIALARGEEVRYVIVPYNSASYAPLPCPLANPLLGLTGGGLNENVCEAYSFLGTKYNHGDEIFVRFSTRCIHCPGGSWTGLQRRYLQLDGHVAILRDIHHVQGL